MLQQLIRSLVSLVDHFTVPLDGDGADHAASDGRLMLYLPARTAMVLRRED